MEVGIVSSQVWARMIYEDVTSIKPPITSKEIKIYSHHHHTVPLGIPGFVGNKKCNYTYSNYTVITVYPY